MNEEFAHGGSEGDFGGFSLGAKSVVEGFDDGVGARGHEGGHVEGNASADAAAVDVALTTEGTAFAIKGSEAGQGSDLSFGEGTEFGESGE